MKTWLLAVGGILALAASVPGDEPAPAQLLPARELNVRDGIGRSAAKLKAGGNFSIAYLGGSITM